MPTSGSRIDRFRRELASLDAVPQFAVLGIAAGLVTGIVILAFRTAVEVPLAWFLAGDHEDFESLSFFVRGVLPFSGAILLAVLFSRLRPEHRMVGVVYVLKQLQTNQGYMSLRNTLVQFAGGMLAMWSGQSVGREGPAIHLGAASSSLIGEFLKLPDNSIRVLVGCGAAAAIAASFNTPIAGVIFSMEVIILEYTVTGFVPVVLAAVTATLVLQLVYGNMPAFEMPAVSMRSLSDIPFLVFEGVAIGMLAAAYIMLVRELSHRAPVKLWQRYLIAGAVTGLAALGLPAVLGIGYDTVNLTLSGELGISVLLLACALKMITSTTSVAMGLPAGLIGPTLFIGATAGGLIGIFGQWLAADYTSAPGFYVTMGMGAMMGAVLQAPLGAMMAVLELTHHANVILPAMLVIVIANITASELFRQRSIFHNQLDLLGLRFIPNPLSQLLDRTSVANVMTHAFASLPVATTRQHLAECLSEHPDANLILVVDHTNRSFLLERQALEPLVGQATEALDLLTVDTTKLITSEIREQATLKEALNTLDRSGANALCVTRTGTNPANRIAGLVTREQINTFLRTD